MKTICPGCKSELSSIPETQGPDLLCPTCSARVPNPAWRERASAEAAAGHAAEPLTTLAGVTVGKDSGNGPPAAAPQKTEETQDVHTAPTVNFEPGDEDLDKETEGEEGTDTAASQSARQAFDQDLEVLKEFGDYEILAEVGRGAMGIVYRARQKHLLREVAIKVLLAGAHASRKQVARFYKEAQAAARLRHPSIVPIHEIGKCQGRHFYTMDFIHGKSLGKLISEGVISIRRALEIVIELADALAYAHAHKVIHRDIKPSNILVDTDGQPHIMDFGLAKQLDSGTKFTQTGSAIGTPAYMSPEQAAGESHRLDHRSDLYSLGTVLYELVTGQPPFEGENMMNIIMQVLNHDPPLPRALNPKVHRDIQTIILKAMEKSPERRYQTVQDFGEDLRRFLAGESIQARPSNFLYRAWRRARKHTLAITAVFVAFLVVSVSSVAILFLQEKLKQKDEELDRLEQEVIRVIQEKDKDAIPQEVIAVADDFEEADLKEAWKPQGNAQTWKVVDGELAASAKGESAVMLDPPVPLKNNVRFEYDARVVESTASLRLDCLIGADPNQAYRFILEGGDSKRRLLLQRSGVNLAQVDVKAFAIGESYHFVLEREDYRLQFEVHGKEGPVTILRYSDLDIIRDISIFRVGFAVWDTPARFDSVRLMREGIPPKPTLFYFPQEQLMLSQDYDVAIEKLTQILGDYKGKFEEQQARHLIGRCWELKGQPQKALEHYLEIPALPPDSGGNEWETLLAENELRKFFCYVPLNRLTEAARTLSLLADRGVLVDEGWVWHFRDILQRCLNTPRLEEALVIFQKVRFEPGGLSLHGLSKPLSQSLYNDFLLEADQLATRLGQGAYPVFDRVIDVYLSFPDPQLTVAFEKSLNQAIQLGQSESALRLLNFTREKLPVSEGLKNGAVALGNEFCKLRQFQRVNEVFQSYPVNELAKSYRAAVDGLLAQGERVEARQLFEKAQAIFKVEKDDPAASLVEEEFETMRANLAGSFASTGAYEELLKIVAYQASPSKRLVAPIELALTRAIDLEEYDPAIQILKVVRERSFPITETLVKETLRLGARLVERQMVQKAQEVYNAFPIPEFSRIFLDLLRGARQRAQEALRNMAEAQTLAEEVAGKAAEAQKLSQEEKGRAAEAQKRWEEARAATQAAKKAAEEDSRKSPGIQEAERRENQAKAGVQEAQARGQEAQAKATDSQKRILEAKRAIEELQQRVHDSFSLCLGILRFVRDKLDQGQMKEAEPQFVDFVVPFAADANQRNQFREVIAAHRAFPSEKLLPQFVVAIDRSFEAKDFESLARLLPYTRQHWPFPAAPEIHLRLIQVAEELARSAALPPASSGSRNSENQEREERAARSAAQAAERLDDLLNALASLEASSEKNNAVQHGAAIEQADLLLLASQADKARNRLQSLAQNLPKNHDLRGHALLRLAALVTDSGEKEAALQHWKALADEGTPHGPFAKIHAFMNGEVTQEIFANFEDKVLEKLLVAQRGQLQGADPAALLSLFGEVVELSREAPRWYTALARERVARLKPSQPASPSKANSEAPRPAETPSPAP